MNRWLALDADLRTALAGVGGLVLGVLVNWAVSSLAYEPRYVSPWSRRHPRDGSSIWLDRLPIYGWLRLSRKTKQLGGGFWVRPLFVEIVMAVGAAALYRWEVLAGGLLPFALPQQVLVDPLLVYALHYAYFAHVLLAAFMLAASLIDVDEMMIPDSITVPGALVGLTVMTFWPWAFLPIAVDPNAGVGVLRAAYGLQADPLAQNFPNVFGLVVAAGCYLLWCGGLLYRPWRTSRGYGVAVRLLWRRVRQDGNTPRIILLAVVGLALIGTVWYYARVEWIGLTSSLVGLAAGGAIVWVTRVIGGWALQREAMGFGDVTLMAMIGAVVGWQPTVLIFFAAPMAALAVHGSRWFVIRILFRRSAMDELPYGPYLCLSTALIVVAWRPVWQAAGPRFAVPWLVPIVLVVGFALLAVVLALLRMLRSRE